MTCLLYVPCHVADVARLVNVNSIWHWSTNIMLFHSLGPTVLQNGACVQYGKHRFSFVMSAKMARLNGDLVWLRYFFEKMSWKINALGLRFGYSSEIMGIIGMNRCLALGSAFAVYWNLSC